MAALLPTLVGVLIVVYIGFRLFEPYIKVFQKEQKKKVKQNETKK